MPPSILPLISEEEYPGFQHLIPEITAVTYEEWQQDHNKAVAYRKTRNGSQEVPISAQDFDWWLKQNRLEAHLELLWVYVEDLAKRGATPTRAPS